MTDTNRLGVSTIEIPRPWAVAACDALMQVIIAPDATDCRTWHGGLGDDGCDHCAALVVLREAAGISPVDHLRP